jgi:hypothetical protein
MPYSRRSLLWIHLDVDKSPDSPNERNTTEDNGVVVLDSAIDEGGDRGGSELEKKEHCEVTVGR